jgi:dihydroorotate dehydrogenase electron transfer subunit
MTVEMNHENVKVRSRKAACTDTFTLELDSEVMANPGQFFMLYLPELPQENPETLKKQGQERPFTVSGIYPLRFTIRMAGPFTELASTLTRRDYIQVTGPLGNGYFDLCDFDADHHYIIGGGCGAAGFGFLANELADIGVRPKALLGAKTRAELFVPDGIDNNTTSGIFKATEDNSDPSGIKGTVLDLIDNAAPEEDTVAYVCGPRKMLVAAADKLSEYGVDPDNILLALEPTMKCGRGVCGSCEVDGYRVCTDGPIFRYSTLADAKDFREYTREKSGKLVPI